MFVRKLPNMYGCYHNIEAKIPLKTESIIVFLKAWYDRLLEHYLLVQMDPLTY